MINSAVRKLASCGFCELGNAVETKFQLRRAISPDSKNQSHEKHLYSVQTFANWYNNAQTSGNTAECWSKVVLSPSPIAGGKALA
ncbi:hypothetical protein QEH59_09525 [Coraliomargarita sp. SDUM461004]|uniref:Integrase catalytic domain-containing protein n=1 Tax=Thalassobacterium sedimentorum TaxID=3041258 RepID=A0ABU1ALD6_9BACT|nr:hypothetical protein [Coraliomargarita sp. SDUM461004]MDQ8194665.1 hypothetical protein [Coraliomargarita sp. SDUM461004]